MGKRETMTHKGGAIRDRWCRRTEGKSAQVYGAERLGEGEGRWTHTEGAEQRMRFYKKRDCIDGAGETGRHGICIKTSIKTI